ncbi:acyltransferase domain-containing protein [Actinomadura madurae]|uniref:acyltransferase domain-containing protein n=1 Tax=Actinomadura madurae TaxID=1993 RepID=UPI0020D236D2|nr:acyltransferase domain-containing protein [Actinomadura madurae]MCP9966588.1 acyltransferase domain-containing protein [Actinomadura madurae]
MGRGLYESSPVFAEVIDRAEEVLRPLIGGSLRDLVFTEDDPARLKATRYCQPALVAVEVALARLWESIGVRPAGVLGHSVGAFAAACVAGALTLEDALTLAATRGRLMDELPGSGAMIACAGDAAAIESAAAASPAVAVAAVNAPGHLVLSGPEDEIGRLTGDLRAKGVTVRRLAVSHAFHSPLMDGAAEPLREAARAVAAREPDIPWISDHTGEAMGRPDAGYWAGHLLGTVRFADGVGALRRLGCDAFVEAGPHPALLGLVRAGLANDAGTVLSLPSLRRGGDDWQTFLRSAGRWYCAGGGVRWAGLDAGRPRRRVPVPHAVFERGPYWLGQRREIEVNGNGYGHAGPDGGGGGAGRRGRQGPGLRRPGLRLPRRPDPAPRPRRQRAGPRLAHEGRAGTPPRPDVPRTGRGAPPHPARGLHRRPAPRRPRHRRCCAAGLGRTSPPSRHRSPRPPRPPLQHPHPLRRLPRHRLRYRRSRGRW